MVTPGLIPIMLQRQANAALAWNFFLLNYLGIDSERAFTVWRALQRCEDARTFVYNWQHMCRSVGHVETIVHLLNTHMSPPRFVALLEVLCTQGLLSRAEVNALEEAILARTTKAGEWVDTP